MSKEQLRAFALIYSMLKTLLQERGFSTSSNYMIECEKLFQEIFAEVLE